MTHILKQSPTFKSSHHLPKQDHQLGTKNLNTCTYGEHFAYTAKTCISLTDPGVFYLFLTLLFSWLKKYPISNDSHHFKEQFLEKEINTSSVILIAKYLYFRLQKFFLNHKVENIFVYIFVKSFIKSGSGGTHL